MTKTGSNIFVPDAKAIVEKNLGAAAAAEIKDFLPFPDLEGEVKNDVEFLKANPAIPDNVNISGWVYEVETGKVKPVV